MNQRLAKRRDEEGFTLIELLIVVIILGILAAVVIFGVSTFRTDSVSKACKTDKKQVQTAAAAYQTKYSTPAASTAALVNDKILQSYPDGGTDYQITYTANAGTYNVGNTGTASC